jgi:FkbH-like protein
MSALIKCVVWDLDGTLWPGVLAEGDAPTLRAGIAALFEALDARGVLQSVASRADADALDALARLGLRDYLLAPQLGPAPKSGALIEIARALNIGVDALLLIDDDPFERAEVQHALPAARALDAAALDQLLALEGIPQRALPGPRRRLLYQTEALREAAQRAFEGTPAAFLQTLDQRLLVRRARPDDLARAQELTERTHQLNATGLVLSAAALEARCARADALVAVAELRDRFGDLGVIGLAVADLTPARWTLRLLLLSCRVMSRGLGGAFLWALLKHARAAGAALELRFVHQPRNRPMWLALRLAGLREVGRDGDQLLLAAPDDLQAPPTPGLHLEVAL